MSDIILRTRNLRKSYVVGGKELPVLRRIDLTVRRGEMISVMGLSGVGKSTLLNILGLLDSPTSGSLSYLVDGREVETIRLSQKDKARLRNRHIGFVFQLYHLLPDLDVLENTLLPAMLGRSTWRFRKERTRLEERARELLFRVGVIERERHRPNQLSGGERQRVAVARSLMNEPALLLCDEPTGNLDTETSERIHDLFEELNRTLRTTILIVTHDPGLASRAHQQLRMVDGCFIDGDAEGDGEQPAREDPLETRGQGRLQ
ncbi:MAG: ABC transporter ATP-binding protein [Planctomycetota bacterium]